MAACVMSSHTSHTVCAHRVTECSPTELATKGLTIIEQPTNDNMLLHRQWPSRATTSLRPFQRKDATSDCVPRPPVPVATLAGLQSYRVVKCRTSLQKDIWVQTANKATLLAALESGVTTAAFSDAASASQASSYAKFKQVLVGTAQPHEVDGHCQYMPVTDAASGEEVGRLYPVHGAEDLKRLETLATKYPSSLGAVAIMDATDWKVIPAENLVALLQPAAGHCKLMAVAQDAEDACVMLGALQVGTQGVLLRSDSPQDVRLLVQQLRQQDSQDLQLQPAEVQRVVQVGLGDRNCVDMAAMLVPGEGLLVGSFARAFFLVHSECAESQYIASRPFRVNAGAVHSYVLGPNGRTAYLSELRSGSEVLVVGPQGKTRVARVGRCKLETRPMVMIEAKAADGSTHSVMLQNAETVKLVGVARSSVGSPAGPSNGDGAQWRPISVATLQPGDQVLLHRPANSSARHTGIPINEWVLEQ